MSITAPLGLLGLLAVPIILALHRRRRRPQIRRTIAAAFLFGPDALPVTAGRERARLVRSPSLWLELLAAIAATVWLSGVRFGDATDPRCIVVLDDSASMAALAEPDRSIRLRVRDVCADRFGAPSRAAPLTVIQSGDRPRIVLGPDAPYALLEPFLAKWQPSASNHPLQASLQLAAEIAGDNGQILMVTDHLDDLSAALLPPRTEVRSLGSPRDNLALQSVDRQPLGEGGRQELVRVEVRSYARDRASCSIEVAYGPTTLASESRSLAPEEIATLTFELPASSSAWAVRIRATQRDALAVDSTYTVLPSIQRPVRFAVTTPPDVAERLGLDRLVDVFGPASLQSVAPSAADLLFSSQPGSARAGAREVLVQATTKATRLIRGPFVTAPWNPLLDGTEFSGVLWSAGTEIPNGEVLLRSETAVLAAERRRPDGGHTLQLNLAPTTADCNVGARPDWPILLTNVMAAARRERPGPAAIHVALGDLLRYRPQPGETAPAEWVDVSGGRHPAQAALATDSTATGTDQPKTQPTVDWTFRPVRTGIHTLNVGNQQLARYSVRFADPKESDLRRCRTGRLVSVPPRAALIDDEAADVAARAGSPGADSASRSLRRVALLTLLLAVLLDYWWLARARRAPRGATVG